MVRSTWFGSHPPACTCVKCNEARLRRIEEARLRGEQPPLPPSRRPVRLPGRRNIRARWLGCGLTILFVLLIAAAGVAYQRGLFDQAINPEPVVTQNRHLDSPSSGVRQTKIAATALTPTTALSPTPILPPYLRNLAEKQYMLDLINQERDRAGVPPVELGTNEAAQLHVESALEHCFSSHWGKDGLKPHMRYSRTGNYQSNAENFSGLPYCYKASDGYRPIQNINVEIREIMDNLMGSPGHRRNIIGRWHKRVNIGIAWDPYNVKVSQHFEGEYVEYDQLPAIESGVLTLSGETKNGTLIEPDKLGGVSVYYDPPAHPLTQGQLSRTYCYTLGLPVAFLRKPLPAREYYVSDEETTSYGSCPNPYHVLPGAAPPSSPAEANDHWQQAHDTIIPDREVTVPDITASEWTVRGRRFSITADIGKVLLAHGSGIYTVILGGGLGGSDVVISVYSIFHETR